MLLEGELLLRLLLLLLLLFLGGDIPGGWCLDFVDFFEELVVEDFCFREEMYSSSEEVSAFFEFSILFFREDFFGVGLISFSI